MSKIRMQCPPKGLFITLEGCEGVGKTTQTAMLMRHFEARGIRAVFTREPGGTPVSEQIRKVILSPDNAMDSLTELFLYAAARREHVSALIQPALAKGFVVVCDRFTDSTMAYQGYGRGADRSYIEYLSAAACQGVTPDLTVFFDLDPESGFRRKGGADAGDRLDSESMAFHKRVYAGFKDIAARQPQRIAAINAQGTPDEVFKRLLAVLDQRLGL